MPFPLPEPPNTPARDKERMPYSQIFISLGPMHGHLSTCHSATHGLKAIKWTLAPAITSTGNSRAYIKGA